MAILALCLCIQKFRSRQPGFEREVGPHCTRNSDFWAAVIRTFGRGCSLFRIESERLKLPAPFSRRIAEPFDADATSRILDLNGEAKTARTKHSSPIMPPA